jgi:DNA polymerase-3 subunit beta
MKLECSVEKLKEAVNKADKIVSKSSSLESLKSILFIASSNSLKIRSTNLSLGLEIEIPAKIESEGEVVVLGDVINNTLSNLNTSDKTITLEKINENLFLNNKKTSITIKSSSSDDFPTIPAVEGNSFNMEVDKFLEGVKAVFYSSAVNDIKPEIASVYIYSQENSTVFVSTDSFRLAEKSIKNKKPVEIEGLIIPFKNVLEIIKLLSDIKGDMGVYYNKNQVSFVLPGFYLTSRLINGSFPDYRQIVPKEFKTKAVLIKKDFIEAIRLSNVFSDKFNQIKLIINPK